MAQIGDTHSIISKDVAKALRFEGGISGGFTPPTAAWIYGDPRLWEHLKPAEIASNFWHIPAERSYDFATELTDIYGKFLHNLEKDGATDCNAIVAVWTSNMLHMVAGMTSATQAIGNEDLTEQIEILMQKYEKNNLIQLLYDYDNDNMPAKLLANNKNTGVIQSLYHCFTIEGLNKWKASQPTLIGNTATWTTQTFFHTSTATTTANWYYPNP